MDSNASEDLEQLREKLRSLECLRGEFDDTVIDQKKAALEARLRASIDTGGGAFIGGDVTTDGGKVVGRDDHSKTEHHHYYGAPSIDANQIEATYRQCIANRCEILPLQNADPSPADGAAEPLSLDAIYIGLDTRQTAPTDAIDQVLKNAADGHFDRIASRQSVAPSLERDAETRAVTALEAAILHRRLVLTGEPGSGKSTFVNHLTHALARQRWERLPAWPERERHALPILVVLRDFARWLVAQEKPPSKASAHLLWDYIRFDLSQWQLGSAAHVLETALDDDHALVLLDGLDEVPADDETQLSLVKDGILCFVERYPRNRYLVTCRVLSYLEPHWRLPTPTFPDLELAHFDEEKIDGFIAAWYQEVGAKWRLSLSETNALADKLRQAVHRSDLWRLARNPLLLTVMALVHSRRRELPEKRALLYEDAVDILLRKREQDKTINAPQIRTLLDDAGRDFNDLKAALEQLAFDTHGSRTVRDEDDGAPIDTLTLLDRVARLHPKTSYDWARQLLMALGQRASLLLERKDGVYSFPHRTFQEYLAGVHLARLESDSFAREAAQRAGERPAYWREVVLLAVGYLVHSVIRDTGKPRLLVEELCPEQAPTTDLNWRKAWLAGDVLWEMGANRVRDTVHGRQLLARVCDRLTALIEQGRLSPRERTKAGDVLAALGDPRFDPQRFYLPADDDLGFVRIPADPTFKIGTRRADAERVAKTIGAAVRDDEINDTSTPTPAFYIGRYPVTVAQFRAFVEAAQFKIDDADALRDSDSRPVCWITWYEARTYCNWLNGVLTHSPAFAGSEIARLVRECGWQVTLPSELEWEKAARGGVQETVFPWGNAPDPNRANVAGSEIGDTSTVGCFPANGFGLHDMIGNIWEWTRSLWGRDWVEPEFRYPYDS
ncbi:MAG: SUMF1/EgtB/PvdO family nonheme iron enzyme, partial [Candidatus Competibacteraceae bacterium]|nr:SUMF1/EgtB/PvdO family nonheme iron enzyme [Candidatus Competibacteraceae bacterium]